MEVDEIIEVLYFHNKWRHGANVMQTDASKLTEALNGALKILIGKSLSAGEFYTHKELDRLREECYQDGYEDGQEESAL